MQKQQYPSNIYEYHQEYKDFQNDYEKSGIDLLNDLERQLDQIVIESKRYIQESSGQLIIHNLIFYTLWFVITFFLIQRIIKKAQILYRKNFPNKKIKKINEIQEKYQKELEQIQNNQKEEQNENQQQIPEIVQLQQQSRVNGCLNPQGQDQYQKGYINYKQQENQDGLNQNKFSYTPKYFKKFPEENNNENQFYSQNNCQNKIQKGILQGKNGVEIEFTRVNPLKEQDNDNFFKVKQNVVSELQNGQYNQIQEEGISQFMKQYDDVYTNDNNKQFDLRQIQYIKGNSKKISYQNLKKKKRNSGKKSVKQQQQQQLKDNIECSEFKTENQLDESQFNLEESKMPRRSQRLQKKQQIHYSKNFQEELQLKHQDSDFYYYL
ncbi:hypothetical protein PPERSA_06641 [Pseudocohnilembus persalinus]|uniref:Transmembrane protein n=1 Tax=Pseudocohnilembus persalinus TaxID=266149 RepID=A0A0V0QRS7_PSEPJ|nr:hypothetical protein PPERSA_06641 [Pseudocohnilembus persalinus]|eukprot:KRX05007.1 hypothetical protein PPERSA_06641 [Pseudocohnilembus persalinus]